MKHVAAILFVLSCLTILSIAQSSKHEAAPRRDSEKHEQPSANPPAQTITIYSQPSPEDHDGTDKQSQDAIDVERKLAKFTWYLVVVGALQLVVLAVHARLFFRQAKTMEQHRTSLEELSESAATNAGISAQTLVLTQRPRIVVRAFYFSDIRGVGAVYRTPNGIDAGSQCSGQFYIQNCGGTNARIREIWCEIFITDSLPMKRPYEGKEGSKEEKILAPGESTFYLFGRFEPLEASVSAEIAQFKTKLFYVLGWIGYTDALGIYRITAFCRRYDSLSKRFLPVDDPDYEYAD